MIKLELMTKTPDANYIIVTNILLFFNKLRQ